MPSKINTGKLSLPHGEALNRALNALLAALELENGAAASQNYQAYQRFTESIAHFEPVRSHLSTLDVAEIVSARVAKHLSKVQIRASGRLIDIVRPEVSRSLREDLRQYLQYLPAPYEVWFALPAIARWGPGGIQLTRDLTLIETAPGAPGVAENSRTTTGLSPEASYVRIKCSGYGAASADCTAMADALSKLKQFFFLAARADLVTHDYGICGVLGGQSAHCHLREDTSHVACEQLMAIAIPDAVRRYLLTANIPVSDRRDALFPALEQTRRLMDGTRDHAEGARIRTAIEWAFDSMQNENQTLGVIQACTGLESLLADEDEDEPALATLADRCAYLLGRGSEQREHVRRIFRAVYRLRARLISRRSARLPADERQVLGLAHGLLCNGIGVAMAKHL